MTNPENMPTSGSSHQQSVSSSPVTISIFGATQSNPSNPIAIDDDQQEIAEGGLFEKKKRKTKICSLVGVQGCNGERWSEESRVHSLQGKAGISGGTTTHFKRHLDGWTRRKVNLKSHKMLNLIPSPVNKEVGTVSNFQYDQGKMRESIAHFILMHEHPFTIVAQEGFNLMMKTSTPHFQGISRATAKNDCMAVYETMKIKLKAMLKNVNKINLTTDLWRSNQQIEYMVVTGHFVDVDWKLQKRVLSFVNVPPPRGGVDIVDALFKCMNEWGIENKIYSIAVDNASYNDVAIRTLKTTLSRTKKLLLGGRLFHVRCCAHILNLLVQDDLKVVEDIIHNVRESVKFVKQSDSRLLKFSEIVK
ncbi:zinc finger BED domain-containing protein RICESLEEPER 2-like [Tripterygium wilfordii]|uniref:zinc finger BED domain-containing protein RICESLEEPER 2-like n=1 Tax=Tripterygium wilfordii TaxID=458696 RepID=UPI0018F81C22|nr:zinc finger BED domain-containing protein RICESLEEPER 2-like [Tripterygium wilfordii]